MVSQRFLANQRDESVFLCCQIGQESELRADATGFAAISGAQRH
jgi:hypothetical protein